MTPLEKAQQILGEVQTLAASRALILPGGADQQYAQVGNNVIACAGVTVTYTGSTMEPLNSVDQVNAGTLNLIGCGPGQIGTFNVVIARDCSNVSNQDGTDNPVEVARVSALMDADGQLLWDFANDYDAWLSKNWSTGHAIEGGLGISSLLLTVGVN